MHRLFFSVAPSGVVYTRWGRKDCAGNDTDLVYSGSYAFFIYCYIFAKILNATSEKF